MLSLLFTGFEKGDGLGDPRGTGFWLLGFGDPGDITVAVKGHQAIEKGLRFRFKLQRGCQIIRDRLGLRRVQLHIDGDSVACE